MARRERPWYWSERKCWYVTTRGRRHRLDPDKDAAFEAWHRLAADESGGTEFGSERGGVEGPAGAGATGGITVGDLIGRYLEAHAQWVGAHTRICVASQLGLLRRSLSGRRVESLRPPRQLTNIKAATLMKRGRQVAG